MTDPRVVLQAIQERANNGPVSDWDPRGGDEPHHRAVDRQIRFDKQLRTDAARLVAAVRAVLDFTVGDKTPIWVGIALDEIIADAMGGTDA